MSLSYWRPHPYKPMHRRTKDNNLRRLYSKMPQWKNVYGQPRPKSYNTRAARLRRRRTQKVSFTRRVKRIISSSLETKYMDTTVASSAPIAGTSLIVPISLISTGESDTKRESDAINIHSIQIRGVLLQDIDNASATTIYKIHLFRQNSNTEGVLPIVTDLFIGDAIYNLRSTDAQKDYSILNTFTFVNDCDFTTQLKTRMINYYHRFTNPKKATYVSGADNIGDTEYGQWFLMLQTNAIQTKQPVLTLKVRLTFKDI